MIKLIKATLLAAAGAVGVTRALTDRTESHGDPPERNDVRKARWKQRFKTIGGFLAVAALGGLLLAVSGLVPIKASSGHWAVTRWFLSFGMKRSVSTHSLGITPPVDLADPSLILKGAGQYDFGCRPCHGSPELHHPRVAAQMTPHPPYLPPVISEWDPGELFYIVKHGVKFTGMPAWPTLKRDDEVWAMVAFLLTLPELDAQEYRRLARGEVTGDEDAPMRDLIGPTDVPSAILESCGRCHGVGGLGRGTGAFPILAGQRPVYLYASLRAYARGERHSGVMEPIAAGLSPGEMQRLARYYSAQESGPVGLRPTPDAAAAIERGRLIATRGIPERGIPSCVDCHGPGASPRNPIYPALAGQYAEYLVLQLELFKQEIRGGTPYAHIMYEVADRLTEEEMHDVALFYASLRADPVASPGTRR